jgi:hypothetical protein
MGKTNGILAQPIGNTTPKTGPGSIPVPPAGGCPSPPVMALEGGGNLPCGSQSDVARKCAAWTCHSGSLRLKSQRGPRAIASGRPVWKAGGEDFKRDFKSQGGEVHRRYALALTRHLVGLVESKYFLAITGCCIGGGTEDSLRWRRMRVITDSWVIAAIRGSDPAAIWHLNALSRIRYNVVGLFGHASVCGEPVASGFHHDMDVVGFYV